MLRSGIWYVVTFILAVCYLLTPTEIEARRLGYSISGNLGSGFSYSTAESDDSTDWSAQRTDYYSLGLDGHILDPRLAMFNLGGALNLVDAWSKQKSTTGDSQSLSFTGNLSILPTGRYPLTLRFSQRHFESAVDTDTMAFGGNWRLTNETLPSVSINFDRVNVKGTGDPGIDSAFTTGGINFTKTLGSSRLAAQFGVQHFADDVRGASTFTHFGNFSDETQWSPATTLRFIADYNVAEFGRSLGSSFTLVNRPDATLNRNLNLGVRNARFGDDDTTLLDAGGSLFKAFKPYPSLSHNLFTRASMSHNFASGDSGDSTNLNWSLGSSAVSTYFRPVLISGAYGLGLTYANQENQGGDVGATQQFRISLQSRTLNPYRARGDYTLTLERTQTDRIRHQASLGADGPITSTLFFRSSAEFFADDATFSDQQTKVSAQQTSLGLSGGLSYTGIRQLSIDLGASAHRHASDSAGSSWITRLTANLNYRPRAKLNLSLIGLRETDSTNGEIRYEAMTRAHYLFGRSTVNVEYRFESIDAFGVQSLSHRVLISINRSFRVFF